MTNILFVHTHFAMFTWHARIHRMHLKKHGIDLDDAEEVFQGVTYTYDDDRFTDGEQRFVTLGLLRGNVVPLVHAPRRAITST